MAYTQSNEIKTRISLKYDTLANWQTNNPELLAGEIAIATIDSANPANKQHPPVMFKVGPGNFNSLDWASALAADVYSWAKQDKITVEKAGTGNVVASISWDATLNEGKGGIKYETAAVATAEGLGDLQTALAQLTEKVNGMYTNDQIDTAIATAKGEAITAAAESAAQKYEEIGVAEAKMNALANGAVKANTDAIAAVLGTSEDAATANTVYGAKAAAAAAQSDATIAKTKIETFLGTVTPGGSEELIDTLAEIQAELDRLGGAVELETQFAAKADKVSGATAGNFAGLDANGNLTDSGAKAADFATAAQGAKADSAVQSVEIGETNGTIKVDGAEVAVKGLGTAAYTDATTYALVDDMNGYIGQAVVTSQEAGTIAGQKIAGWDNLKTKQTLVSEKGAADKTLMISQNENGEILAKPIPIQIATSQVTDLDGALAAKANDADLAAVAKTGDIGDLTQTENEYVWFNCGTSTTVI